MSASPSQPNGHTATPTGSSQTGHPQVLRRKKRPVDPLVSRKRPTPRPAPAAPRPAAGSPANGLISLGAKDRPGDSGTSVTEQELRAFQAEKARNGGWTDPAPQGSFKEYGLFATPGSVLKDSKFHIMRFTRPNRAEDTDTLNVDPTDQNKWPRPITLNRRDPRFVGQVKQQPKEETPGPNAVDPAELERLEKIKVEREALRASDLAQIAPVIKDISSKPKPKRKEEGTVSRFTRDTAEAKKQSQLRYQEAYPWVMEDAEGKNLWVGRREAPLSEVNVALIVSGDGFRMLPLEGYYKFAAKQKFTTYNLAEAENQMKKRVQPPRWILTDQEEKKKKEKEYNDYREFMGGRQRVKTESATSRAAPKSERNDEYEVDMEGEEFQDDDENPGFEADDENERDTKGRVRREQLGANLFGDGDEEEVQKEEEDEQFEKLRRKLEGKAMKKALKKREKAFEYETESDSDEENPFSDTSVSNLHMRRALLSDANRLLGRAMMTLTMTTKTETEIRTRTKIKIEALTAIRTNLHRGRTLRGTTHRLENPKDPMG
jgi:transcription initiation factor TFIIF subunit alpha